jgi:alpha-N-arabinofuranosidase
VIESNAFGTHEFMELVEQLGSEAYISGNLGSGSVQEMRDWVEYLTSDSESTLAKLRRANGRAEPWKIAYFGIGNESWGCGGTMRPAYYADEYRRYQSFVSQANGSLKSIATGAGGDDYNWTEVLMREAGSMMSGLSLHYYTLPSGDWKTKGSATVFGESEWAWTLQRTLKMDELLQKHSAIMDKYDPAKKVGLMVDEWGTWYDAEPNGNHGVLYQQNTLRDALVAALNLNIFHAHAERVKLAAVAQMVNVLQAMILTDRDRMVLTPTYHVFEMYKVHQGANFVPLELTAPNYRYGEVTLPMVSATASRDAAGKLHVSLVNVDPHRAVDISATLVGVKARRVTGRVLTASTMTALNTFEQPQAVQPVAFTGARISGERLTARLPAKSVLALEFE